MHLVRLDYLKSMIVCFQSEKDSCGITKEELILGLRQCLAATPHFAQYCLPLLLEKLTSDLKSAKIDSLETLVSRFFYPILIPL